MIDCLILGDSIAVGVAQRRPACEARAQVGISTNGFLARYQGLHEANTVVISLGSNDAFDDLDALRAVRASVAAKRVVWILPANPRRNIAVRYIAGLFGDEVCGIPELSPDRVHPTAEAYKQLAEAI